MAPGMNIAKTDQQKCEKQFRAVPQPPGSAGSLQRPNQFSRLEAGRLCDRYVSGHLGPNAA